MSTGRQCTRLAAMQTVYWCRDVDWGTAPQWATVVIAFLALCVSTVGIGTAVSSYRASVRNTREAQARLVYGRLGSVKFYSKGQDAIKVLQETGTSTLQPGIRLFDKNMDRIKYTEEARAYFTLRIVNKSKEIIGDVEMGVVESSNKKPERWVRTFTDAVDPEDSHEYMVGVIDERWFGSYSLTPWVEFIDSGGTKWRRIGTEPVKQVKPDRFWRHDHFNPG
jgi:hypothetical protein